MTDDLKERLRANHLDERYEAIDHISALEAALSAALERLDASLFTNAEHQQAKDILREARKPSLDA